MWIRGVPKEGHAFVGLGSSRLSLSVWLCGGGALCLGGYFKKITVFLNFEYETRASRNRFVEFPK